MTFSTPSSPDPSHFITQMSVSLIDSPPSTPVEKKSNHHTLELLYKMRPSLPTDGMDTTVLKLKNIPWDISTTEISQFFSPLRIPYGHEAPYFSHGIHIIMNRNTGKTLSECYVEFPFPMDAKRALLDYQHSHLKGRSIQVTLSNHQELFQALFPSSSCHLSFLLSGTNTPGTYLTREEISFLLSCCKNFKLHFSRKVPERPFESVISILTKLPWSSWSSISLMQRDHVFEMLKISIESLVVHLSKDVVGLSIHVLDRLVRAGLCVPLFTEKQKVMILCAAGFTVCPMDLVRFVYYAPETTVVKDENLVNPFHVVTPFPHSNSPPAFGVFSNNNNYHYNNNVKNENETAFHRSVKSPFAYNYPTPIKSDSIIHSSTPMSGSESHGNGNDTGKMGWMSQKHLQALHELKLAKDELIQMQKDIENGIKREKEFKVKVKSLERRNDELESLYFTNCIKNANHRIWGTRGLWMEFTQ